MKTRIMNPTRRELSGFCLIRSLALMSSVALLLASTTVAPATVLNISGSISGTINGQGFTATSAGSADTATGLGSATVTYSSLPYDFPVFAGFNSVLSIVCGNGCYEQAGALNLYDLTGGNYSTTRAFTYDDFPGSTVSFSGTVTCSGDNLSYTETWSGTYNGPQNLVGVTGYQLNFVPNGPGSVLTPGSGQLFDSSDNNYPGEWTGGITGFSGQLSTAEVANIDWTTQQLSGNVETLAWDGVVSVVPEPSASALVGLGTLGLLAYAGRRQRAKA